MSAHQHAEREKKDSAGDEGWEGWEGNMGKVGGWKMRDGMGRSLKYL
jgi:hypothetical protein